MRKDQALPVSLGIDLGTSAVKVVALGADASILGEAAASFPTLSALPAQAEQDPADWSRAVSAAMRLLADAITASFGFDLGPHVAAIGVTGQLPTLVCLGFTAPLAPVVTWKDGRADEWAAARIAGGHRAAMYARTGMPLDGRYLAPMLQFHFAPRLPEVRRVLSAKDYLLWLLTGLEVTEPSTAAGYGTYDARANRFSGSLCDFWHFPRRLLPELRQANELAGPLNEAGAALLGLPAGIPVSTGAADSVCAAYAMAGLDERAASVSFGSSAVIIGASRTFALDRAARYLLTPHVSAGWYGREMDLLATGTGYRWLSDLFEWTDGRIDAEAARSIPGAHALFFPPYLAGGEQGALWNPRLVSALIGLNVRHTRADIARAYLEGVFFEVKRCIEVLAETAPVESMTVSGKIVESQASLQMLSDIIERPVHSMRARSPAALGAASLARQISSRCAATARDPCRVSRTTQPDSAIVELYGAVYRAYLERAARCD